MTSSRRNLAARRRNKETGSQIFSEPVFVLVGILRRPHGLKGEALVTIETDFPERLKKGVKLYLGEEHTPITVRSQRNINEGLLLAFEELPERESLENIRNMPLFSRIEDSPTLPAGKFYRHQLMGMDVFTEDNQTLGKIVQVLDTTANDVYVVQPNEGKEILLPAIQDVIQTIDLDNKRMTVHLLPGLLPEE